MLYTTIHSKIVTSILCLLLVVPVVVFAETDEFGNPINNAETSAPCVGLDEFGNPCPATERDNRAGTGGGGGSVTIDNPLKANSITELFLDLIEVVLVFATPIIVFFIIYAGFLYVTARGNPEQISQANRALLYAVIGGVLILGAFVILSVIQGTVDAITI